MDDFLQVTLKKSGTPKSLKKPPSAEAKGVDTATGKDPVNAKEQVGAGKIAGVQESNQEGQGKKNAMMGTTEGAGITNKTEDGVKAKPDEAGAKEVAKAAIGGAKTADNADKPAEPPTLHRKRGAELVAESPERQAANRSPRDNPTPWKKPMTKVVIVIVIALHGFYSRNKPPGIR